MEPDKKGKGNVEPERGMVGKWEQEVRGELDLTDQEGMGVEQHLLNQ